MLNVKKFLATSLLLVLPFVFQPVGMTSGQEIPNPLEGRIIALDAGHGGTELGATYPANTGEGADVYEKDVNLAVVYALKEKLELDGVHVVLTRVCDETVIRRKDRVDLAIEKCKDQFGKKCDVLVSVHHNGSTDPTHDGTMVIYNEKQDIPLATALLETLVPLTGNNEGLDHGGYGMTVYGHLVSALTEAYYITNADEAGYYLEGTLTTICQNSDGSDYQVRIGERVNQEVDALYQGLIDYFSSFPENGGGNGEECIPNGALCNCNGKCNPKESHDTCPLDCPL